MPATKSKALDSEFAYYEAHRDEIDQQYPYQFIVIVGDKVVGAYSTLHDAIVESVKSHKPGTFLIQECLPGQDLTQYFHTPRVRF